MAPVSLPRFSPLASSQVGLVRILAKQSKAYYPVLRGPARASPGPVCFVPRLSYSLERGLVFPAPSGARGVLKNFVVFTGDFWALYTGLFFFSPPFFPSVCSLRKTVFRCLFFSFKFGFFPSANFRCFALFFATPHVLTTLFSRVPVWSPYFTFRFVCLLERLFT